MVQPLEESGMTSRRESVKFDFFFMKVSQLCQLLSYLLHYQWHHSKNKQKIGLSSSRCPLDVPGAYCKQLLTRRSFQVLADRQIVPRTLADPPTILKKGKRLVSIKRRRGNVPAKLSTDGAKRKGPWTSTGGLALLCVETEEAEQQTIF